MQLILGKILIDAIPEIHEGLCRVQQRCPDAEGSVDLNEQSQERLSLIIEQMKASEGVTEELKAADQMAWLMP